jgi:acyl carrier protein
MSPARKFDFEKRIVWEILLGQRGSKTSLGQKQLGMRHNLKYGYIRAENFLKNDASRIDKARELISIPGREEIIAILNKILEEDFEIDPSLLKPEASLRDDLDLDSLDGVDLVVAIEKKFRFRVDEEEARSIRTLNDIYESVDRRLRQIAEEQP